jgi:hypothetical protein
MFESLASTGTDSTDDMTQEEREAQVNFVEKQTS